MKKTKAPTDPDQPTAGKSKTAVRGKYFSALQENGSNLVLLDPALTPFFPDSESVNKALRAYIEIKATMGKAAPGGRSRKEPKLPLDPAISSDPSTGTRPKAQPRSRKAA